MNEGTWVQGKSMNVMHQTGNVAWSIFDADYGKYNRMSLENGTGGDMEVTVTITDGKISDIVVNSHAESSDIGAPALDKLIQNAIAANSAEIDGASGATMTSDGFREAGKATVRLYKKNGDGQRRTLPVPFLRKKSGVCKKQTPQEKTGNAAQKDQFLRAIISV